MGRPPRPPAVLIVANVSENAKLAALPNDTARLGYVYMCVGRAKLQQPIPGQFASRQVFREVAGRFARYVEDYLTVGLIEEAPALCDKCRARWAGMPPAAGVLVTHDWHEFQYDPWHAERQQAYADRKAAAEATAKAAVLRQESRQKKVRNPSGSRVRPRAGAADGADRGAHRTRNSERFDGESQVPPAESARDGSRNPAAQETTGATNEPRLTAVQAEAWRPLAGSMWAPFRVAWFERGFRMPPSLDTQTALFEAADAQPRRLGHWVDSAPPASTAYEVVAFVLEAWHRFRADALQQAALADAEWDAAKIRDRYAAQQGRPGFEGLADLITAAARNVQSPEEV